MKSFLIVLFIILLASGSQTRQIPADSLFDYYETARSELLVHIGNFRKISEAVVNQQADFDRTHAIYNALISSLNHFNNIITFFQLESSCDNKSAICYGLDQNCAQLAGELQAIQFNLLYSKHQLTTIQGNDAKKFLEQVLADFVDSIEDDDCRKQVNESVANVKSD